MNFFRGLSFFKVLVFEFFEFRGKVGGWESKYDERVYWVDFYSREMGMELMACFGSFYSYV